jgi:branched-chain amino acid aminotransferase
MEYIFPITRAGSRKPKPDPNDIAFGTVFTDYMFEMDYNPENGWHNGKLVPYGPLRLEPSTACFHYAQGMFEGLKAYRSVNDRILLFRPEENVRRTNATNERICIPLIDEALLVGAIKAVVDLEREWVPAAEGTSLYIRPFIIATDPHLGVHPSKTFKLFIILSPVGAYYKGGFSPTKILVEDIYVRAMEGGTGFAKVVGNYAASLKAQKEAIKKGYHQVLWLDGITREYVEEIGTSNAFFKIDGEVITPSLIGTILPGINRDSVLRLLRHWGIKTTEKKLKIQDVYNAHTAGKLEEVFATGTATVISPVGELCWKDQAITINNNQIGELSQKLYDQINGIQKGALKDEFGWVVEV